MQDFLLEEGPKVFQCLYLCSLRVGNIMGKSCQAQCEYNFNNQYTNIPINYNNQTRSLVAHHRPIERLLAEQLRLHCFQISSV